MSSLANPCLLCGRSAKRSSCHRGGKASFIKGPEGRLFSPLGDGFPRGLGEAVVTTLKSVLLLFYPFVFLCQTKKRLTFDGQPVLEISTEAVSSPQATLSRVKNPWIAVVRRVRRMSTSALRKSP